MAPVTNQPDHWAQEVELPLLGALQQPSTIRQIVERTGLTPDVVKNQLEVFVAASLAIREVQAGVRYQLTLAGRARLTAPSRFAAGKVPA